MRRVAKGEWREGKPPDPLKGEKGIKASGERRIVKIWLRQIIVPLGAKNCEY